MLEPLFTPEEVTEWAFDVLGGVAPYWRKLVILDLLKDGAAVKRPAGRRWSPSKGSTMAGSPFLHGIANSGEWDP